MAQNCQVKNLLDQAITLPYPYNVVLGPCGGGNAVVVVNDTLANVMSNLGGSAAVTDVFELSDTSVAGIAIAGTLPVLAALAAVAAPVVVNSQKVSSMANGTAATDAAALGQLPGTLTMTPGAKTGKACNVVCAVVDATGAALSAGVEVKVVANPKAGTITIAAATASPVGTLNWTNSTIASMTTDATGHFSFNVADTNAEDVLVTVEAPNCRLNFARITLTT